MLDHFRILRLLGTGGMARVYLARDTKLGRKVALKVIRPGELDSDESRERFLFEARATASFNHPHIVTIYAVGDASGVPYVALEYLQGQSLRQRVDQEQPSVPESLRYCLAIAQALAEAHAERILHRDLKPANVMLGRDGRLRVLDFGLARAVTPRRFSYDPDSASITARDSYGDGALRSHDFLKVEDVFESAHSKLWGTPAYMAPEQWRQGEITTAVDIWALGTVLYELVSGHRPYEESYTPALAYMVGEDEPVPELIADVSPELKDLVHRCLAKEAVERPSAAQVVQELAGLLKPRNRNVSGVSPFRGLFPFNEGHSALFFGRDAEIEAFVERLRRQPLIPVLGSSGAGKSSFVMAGVIPRLREHGPVVALTMRPGSDPFRVLALKIIAAQENDGRALDEDLHGTAGNPWDTVADVGQLSTSKKVDRLARRLAASPPMLNLELSRLAGRRNANVLLFVDQLEEVQTLVTEPAVRAAFMQAICSAADDAQLPVRVLFTLREEFLSRLAEGIGVREALSHINVLRSPGPTALHEILARPVEALGYEFDDPALVDEMVAEVRGETSCLPLLQFAGQMLWEGRDDERRLLLRSVYEAMGGVAGALAQHADGVLAGMSGAEVGLARTMLLRLVTGEGTRRVLQRSAVLDGLEPRAEDVLRKLTAARLITGRQSDEAEGEGDVEIVHESLTVTWRRLARWIEAGKEELSFLAEVGQAAKLWDARGRRPAELWEGDALHEARRTLERCTTPIPQRVTLFLEAATRREVRQIWRVRGLVGAAIVLLVVIASVLAFQKIAADEQRVEAQLQRAEAQREGARAALGGSRVFEARAKLRAAVETEVSPSARALWWTLRENPLIWKKQFGASLLTADFSPQGDFVAVGGTDQTIYLLDVRTLDTVALRGHEGWIYSVVFSPSGQQLASTDEGHIRMWDLAGGSGKQRWVVDAPAKARGLSFSPDGNLLASIHRDGTIRLWDSGTGEAGPVLPIPDVKGIKVRFHPEGHLLAACYGDGAVRIWNPATGKLEHEMKGHVSSVLGLNFRPDGQQLASAGTDGTVQLWDTRTWQRTALLEGHTAGVYSVHYHPDGSLLASGSTDKSLRLWDVASGQPRRVLHGHSGSVSMAVFSPDGQQLLSVGRGHEARLWDTRIPPKPVHVGGHTDGAHRVVISPDGKTIASASRDHTIRLWDVHSGALESVLEGHSAGVHAVDYSPDGRRLVSGSNDKTVRLWDVQTGLETDVLGRHTSVVYCTAFSPDGLQVASGGSDRLVRVWDVASGRQEWAGSHDGGIVDVTFSPDGRQLVSAGFDKLVRVWDAASGRLIHEFSGHTGSVIGVSFSPDGSVLASGGGDSTARLWDTTGGRALGVLGPFADTVYWLTFHPDGDRLGVPVRDGTARIWSISGGERAVFSGHRDEVNSIDFTPDGQLAVTSGDDGTVRMWDVATGQPYWKGPLLLGAPPRLLSHRGWTTPGSDDPLAGPRAHWQQALEQRALYAESFDGETLCVWTQLDHIEGWDLTADKLVFEQTAAAPQQLVAVAGGCAVRHGTVDSGDGGVQLYFPDADPVQLALEGTANAMGYDGDQLLVVTEHELWTYRTGGELIHRREVPTGVTAISVASPRWLVLGFNDGNIELLPVDSSPKPQYTFEEAPFSSVTELLPGPENTIIGGYVDGTVGIWNLTDGKLLRKTELHGRVNQLLLEDQQLFAATELGQSLDWDLQDFYSEPCELVRDVWARVPVVWDSGRAVVREAPADHECAPVAK